MLRQRQLDEVAVAGRVGVQLVDDGFELLLRDVGGQVAPDRVDPDLAAVGVLHPHVRVRPRVVADQDRAQARCHPLRGQRRDARFELRENGVLGGLAVENLRRHVAHSGKGTPARRFQARVVAARRLIATPHGPLATLTAIKL